MMKTMPQYQEMVRSNPQLEQMMSNPEMIRQMFSKENLQLARDLEAAGLGGNGWNGWNGWNGRFAGIRRTPQATTHDPRRNPQSLPQ